MKLLVDIGNTRSKFALCDGDTVLPAFVVDHADLDEASLERRCSDTLAFDSAWISCVGPTAILSTIDLWISHRFKILPEKIRVSEETCGVTNGYHDLEALGVDRWMAAVGTRALYPDRDILIVDAGTAITIDWLSRNNVFEGGVIIPGYGLMHDSLISKTSGIQSRPEATQRIIGKTTVECVNSGLSYGVVGAVERIVIEMQQHISIPSKVVLTGGGADQLALNLSIKAALEPQLVLQGIATVAQAAR